jgi:lactoylglutathione lyase
MFVAGLVNLYTRDIEAGLGVPTLQPPHDTGNNNRNALLRDPDGNLVEIVGKVKHA